MVSDDLSYEVLKKEFDRIRALYEEEKKKTAELENRLKEQEKQFTEQYEKLLKIEKGLVSGEETLHTIQQEKIQALSRHLAREHKRRLDVEDAMEKLEEEYKQKLAEERAEREKLLADKDREIASVKEELKKRDELVAEERKKSEEYGARELDTILDVVREPSKTELIGGEDSSWITETQDLIRVLHRWGSIKLTEASQTMDLDDDTVRSYAKILEEKGLIKVEDEDSDNPRFRATRDLVGKLNELITKKRRRGRLE